MDLVHKATGLQAIKAGLDLTPSLNVAFGAQRFIMGWADLRVVAQSGETRMTPGKSRLM